MSLAPVRVLGAGVLAVVVVACGSGGASTVSVETFTYGSITTPAPTPAQTGAPTAAATSSPALPPDVIGVTAARALVDRWNGARAAAANGGDPSALAAVEDSPALDVDTVELRLERSGAARRIPAPSVDEVAVDVPHQSSYPAVVYATQRVTRSGVSAFEFLGFSEAAAGAPWKLAWHATTPDARTVLPAMQSGADGFGEVLGAAAQRGLVLDVAALASRLATELRTGSDPVVVLDQGLPDIGATARQTVASFARSGGSAGVSFVGSATPVALRTTDGGTSCVVTITYTATLDEPPGRPLVETAANPRYGLGLLAPGSYSQVVDRYVFMFEAAVPSRTGGATVFVHAVTGGIVASSGTPTAATPAPSPVH